MKAAADTAWIDGRDPLYTAVADKWMEQIVADFGSDHVWQMDAFFSNGSGWGAELPVAPEPPEPLPVAPATVPCAWSAAINNTYLAGYVHGKLPAARTRLLLRHMRMLPAPVAAAVAAAAS